MLHPDELISHAASVSQFAVQISPFCHPCVTNIKIQYHITVLNFNEKAQFI